MPYLRPQSGTEVRAEIHRIAPAGDHALVVEFAAHISRDINQRVRDLEYALAQASGPEIVATVPSYRSLLVYFDPVDVSFEELSQRIRSLSQCVKGESRKPKRWTLPVCYGEEYGPDLNDLAATLSVPSEEVIEEHSAVEYMVYMIGFSPGFAYLGELPTKLEVPRKTVLAPLVPANTIQIGGQQTAVSSMPMPTGWYVVGRTPIRTYDSARHAPFLLEGGDFVKFEAITSREFRDISAKAATGEYQPIWQWAL